jgi:TrmH family RNA methyltransferase
LHQRKERHASGLFLAEGMKIAAEALALGRVPSLLMFGPEVRDHPVLRTLVIATYEAGGDVVEAPREILQKVSRRDNPQTVLAVFPQAFAPLHALQPSGAPCWVALEQVRDPGNLGTIIRTADAAGCGGVILIGDCCDPYSVEAVRATMGSVFAVPLFKTSEADFLAWRALWPGVVVGTLLTADKDHREAVYSPPSLILLGNEQHGLTPALAAACDFSVKIPMRGRADSLNLSVAAGIMIYSAAR